ncbi:hypothetical protein HK102_000814 [Quaeritorhiza haematococci]|nr:hypothetical protein HK102_000814 [Quaeritorhiza haematococci]
MAQKPQLMTRWKHWCEQSMGRLEVDLLAVGGGPADFQFTMARTREQGKEAAAEMLVQEIDALIDSTGGNVGGGERDTPVGGGSTDFEDSTGSELAMVGMSEREQDTEMLMRETEALLGPGVIGGNVGAGGERDMSVVDDPRATDFEFTMALTTEREREAEMLVWETETLSDTNELHPLRDYEGGPIPEVEVRVLAVPIPAEITPAMATPTPIPAEMAPVAAPALVFPAQLDPRVLIVPIPIPIHAGAHHDHKNGQMKPATESKETGDLDRADRK